MVTDGEVVINGSLSLLILMVRGRIAVAVRL